MELSKQLKHLDETSVRKQCTVFHNYYPTFHNILLYLTREIKAFFYCKKKKINVNFDGNNIILASNFCIMVNWKIYRDVLFFYMLEIQFKVSQIRRVVTVLSCSYVPKQAKLLQNYYVQQFMLCGLQSLIIIAHNYSIQLVPSTQNRIPWQKT